MTKRKPMRTRGKIQLSRYFQNLKEGDTVAVVKEMSISSTFPKRLQGRTGNVAGKRGRSYIVNILDQSKPKTFIIEPIHLKKIKLKW